MKKLILALVIVGATFAAQAQQKVTKTSIVGEWKMKAIGIEEVLFYDIEKDSLSLTKEILEKLAASGADSASTADMMKGQFEALKEVVFTFTADGKYKTTGSGNGKDEAGTYTLDEATETLVLETPKDGKQEIKASFKANGRLLLPMPSPSGPKTTLEFSK